MYKITDWDCFVARLQMGSKFQKEWMLLSYHMLFTGTRATSQNLRNFDRKGFCQKTAKGGIHMHTSPFLLGQETASVRKRTEW